MASLRGPHIHGPASKKFIYITWGVVAPSDSFRMFRRAKIWLDAVPDDVMGAACHHDLLIGRLRLTDDKGWPLCAAVRPPRIQWSAGSGSNPDGRSAPSTRRRGHHCAIAPNGIQGSPGVPDQ